MPPHIFANTGTSVSIVFIDKAKQDDNVMLMDASNLGTKVSLEDGQRTVLSIEEKEKIMSFFKGRVEEPEFSALIDKEKIKENGYSVQAGQYVEILDIILDFDIDQKILELNSNIKENIEKSRILDAEIMRTLEV